MIRIKCSTKHYPNLLWHWLIIKDIYQRSGLKLLTDEQIYFVHDDQPADIGISWHGDKVKGVPKNKCILLKTEPPIYNVLYGRNLCNPNYMDKYMAVLSLYKERYNNSYHFIYPCISHLFKYVETHFDLPKEEMLCMVLRNKKWIHRINKLFPKLKNYNKYSNYELKKEYDETFASLLAHTNYHSYGRGWDSRCFKGKLEDREDIYKIFANHKFTFCPENSRFPGFITEKPLQAMFCGSIPIYLGPPDIDNYLPKETYIDLRTFDSAKVLVAFLKYLNEIEIEQYRDRIRKFVTSKRTIDMFSPLNLAHKVLQIVKETY